MDNPNGQSHHRHSGKTAAQDGSASSKYQTHNAKRDWLRQGLSLHPAAFLSLSPPMCYPLSETGPSTIFQCIEGSTCLPYAFLPLASEVHGRCYRRKLRHTTHLEGFPSNVTIVRDHHPLQGQVLELFSWCHRQGNLYLTLVLPDGSRSLIPAVWTDLNRNLQTSCSDDGRSISATLGSLSHLLHARKVVDSLLRKLEPSDQAPLIHSKEERRRATPTRPLARSGKTASGTGHLARPRPRDKSNGHRHPGQADPQGGSPKNSGGQP